MMIVTTSAFRLGIGPSFLLRCALPLVTDRESRTHRRGRSQRSYGRCRRRTEIPGAINEGATREEARSNVLDALETLLTPDKDLAGEPPDEDGESLTLTVAS